MSENRLLDYLDHMQQAAMDACSFVELKQLPAVRRDIDGEDGNDDQMAP